MLPAAFTSVARARIDLGCLLLLIFSHFPLPSPPSPSLGSQQPSSTRLLFCSFHFIFDFLCARPSAPLTLIDGKKSGKMKCGARKGGKATVINS
jgi:hypothetical protein